MDKGVTTEITLGALETIVEEKGGFKPFGIDGLEILSIDGYEPNFSDANYKKQFIARMNDRIGFIEAKDTVRGGYDKLPAEALESMKKVAEAAQKL
jgi:phosphoenolpyruvate carboxykinase (ATP)